MKNILLKEMDKPKAYGLFHISFIFITIFTAIILAVFINNISDRTFKMIILSFSLLIIILEIIKEIKYTFYMEPYKKYKTRIFPFQLCSLSLYIYPLILILNESLLKDSFIVFSSTFLLFGGFIVYIVPTTFSNNIFLNIQTMVHHGTQIIIGILLLIYNYDKFNINSLLISLLIFVVCSLIAIILNEISYLVFKNKNELNLFYLSRHIENEVPVLKNIYDKSYCLFIISYILGFLLVGTVIFFIEKYGYMLIGSVIK